MLIVECVLCVLVRSHCIVCERQVKVKFCIRDLDLYHYHVYACSVHHCRHCTACELAHAFMRNDL